MCGIMMWGGKHSNHIFRLLFKHGVSPCLGTDESDAKQILTACPLENWRRPPGHPCTMWMKTTHYPAGPGIIEPLPEWSNWRGSESSTLENDVYVWRFVTRVTINQYTVKLIYQSCCHPAPSLPRSPSESWIVLMSSGTYEACRDRSLDASSALSCPECRLSCVGPRTELTCTHGTNVAQALDFIQQQQ